MKIVYTSDLHYDASPHNPEAIRQVAAEFKKLEPDVVILAGDLGDTLDSLEKVLTCFADIDAARLLVPGNHDLWIEPGKGFGQGSDSGEKYASLIPALAGRLDFVDLGQGPFYLGNVGFVGSLGWYDYTLADPRLGLSPEDYQAHRFGDKVWWDHSRINWRRYPRATDEVGLTDREICEGLAAKLEAHILEAENQAERIVAVVHTCPFEAVFERSEEPHFFDAFQGSARLGEILLAHDKIEYCVTGHKHTGGDWRQGRLNIHRRILGSVEENDLIGKQVRAAVGVLEI
jgi:predicted phosphohydrolase